MSTAHSESRPNPAVLAFLQASGGPGASLGTVGLETVGLETVGLERVSLEIDTRDEMLGHLLAAHHGSVDRVLVGYFQTGLMGSRLLADVLSSAGLDSPHRRVLDFAGGYGRVARFLAARPEAPRLTVADVDAEAVAFQTRELGVEGFVSATDPENLEIEDRFDAVFVASLFSHLPARRFAGWLSWLYRHLTADGVLVLSVHGEETLLAGRSMPESGIYFEDVSESRRFVAGEYGSSWVSEAFVAGAIEEISAGQAAYRRFPRALWHAQDVYVVARREARDLSALELAPVPEGYLDTCYLEDARTLRVAGWAGVAGGSREPLVVSVSLDGRELATTTPADPRPDVAATLAGSTLAGSVASAAPPVGWSVRASGDRPFSSQDMLVVSARVGESRHVLHAGTIEGTGLYLALVRSLGDRSQLRAERERAVAELAGVRQALADESARVRELDAAVHEIGWQKHVLEAKIAAMEQSRFWRLRERWRRLTAALREPGG